MDFNFFMPVEVISGENCVQRSGSLLGSFGKCCLIITSGHAAAASGALTDMTETLSASGVSTAVFSGIGANPLLSQCQAAALAAQSCHADFIVGIGGGSVMDASKAAAWLAANNAEDGEMLMKGALPNPPLPLILVGTTAGTGSEVSSAAVLTMDDDHRKKSVAHPCCYARIAFADPRYTHTVSRETTISTALDAFCHAAEGWFVPACGDVITSFGEKALPLVMKGLEWLKENEGLPDAALRDQLYYGSLWAGMVLNTTGTAFPHPLGYILTEEYGLPHGTACAVFLPVFLRRAEEYAPGRAAEFFELCGGREKVVAMLEALAHVIIEMSDEQITSYRERWQNVKNFSRTPGGFTADDANKVYRSLFLKP